MQCKITPTHFNQLTNLNPTHIKESTGLFNLYFHDGTVCSYTKSQIINLLLKEL